MRHIIYDWSLLKELLLEEERTRSSKKVSRNYGQDKSPFLFQAQKFFQLRLPSRPLKGESSQFFMAKEVALMALNKKDGENKFPPISVHNKASKYITLSDDAATLFFMKRKRGRAEKTFAIRVTEQI